MLMTAEKRLAAGDPKGRAGTGAAGAGQEDRGRRDGRCSSWRRWRWRTRIVRARLENFQKAIQATKDPKVVAWSHVYLGRILDMKEDREGAMNEYRAALTTRLRRCPR